MPETESALPEDWFTQGDLDLQAAEILKFNPLDWMPQVRKINGGCRQGIQQGDCRS
jgi:hypothetical protein